jgi:hypothetical protein
MAEDRNLERLREVVAAYGAEPDRWPPDERGALEPLARALDGASWIAEERELDRLLDAAPGARMRAGLADDIIAAARTAARAIPDRVVTLRTPLRVPHIAASLLARSGPATVLAASLAAGLWLGATDQIETLVDGEPLGLAEFAPGISDGDSLSLEVFDTFSATMSLP